MKLTVSMATYDDYDGVFFTLMALRMYHGLRDVEFLVLDNNPNGPHGEALRKLAAHNPCMRLIPVTDRKSSWVKYDAFKYATGDVVLGLDCHVLLQPSFFPAFFDFWKASPGSRDMLTGPVVFSNLTSESTHMDPQWRGHDFGTWGNHPSAAAGQPFEVPMQGMGCFAIRRDAWQGIHSGFQGFGSEEWYIAEKVRSWGGRVICHPALRWVHRFGWPERTFPLSLELKVKNYYRGWLDLYGSLDHPRIQEMTAHWLTKMPQEKLDRLIASL